MRKGALIEMIGLKPTFVIAATAIVSWPAVVAWN